MAHAHPTNPNSPAQQKIRNYAVFRKETGDLIMNSYGTIDQIEAIKKVASPETVIVETDGILNKDAWHLVDGVVTRKPQTAFSIPHDFALDISEDGTADMTVPPNATVTVVDGSTYQADGSGRVRVKVPHAGRQAIKVHEPGKEPVSARVGTLTIVELKERMTTSANEERAAELNKPIDIGGNRKIDGGQDSQFSFLLAAFSAAVADRNGTPWSIEWVLANNDRVTLGINDMMAGVSAIQDVRTKLALKARREKDAIVKAKDPKAVREAKNAVK